ncbi:MAG TPA: dephospho-CoA kinase [Verrucomicrobiales bacterium]|nr:dephospho-CoA kinase [Verrucomicrobiales bacterium]
MSTRVIGLTGGVGMGKSTAARLLAKRGLPVVDSDDLAREVVSPGQPALEEIAEIFGAEFIVDGKLDRQRMAGEVFGDDAARARLEAIIHPRVRELWQGRIEQWRANEVPVGVVVIPLLFEVGAETEMDTVVCLACTANTQRDRLRARGWDAVQISARIGAQMDIAQKMELADHVLWNEGTLDALAAQLQRIVE